MDIGEDQVKTIVRELDHDRQFQKTQMMKSSTDFDDENKETSGMGSSDAGASDYNSLNKLTARLPGNSEKSKSDEDDKPPTGTDGETVRSRRLSNNWLYSGPVIGSGSPDD